jgi:hypothetical protein
MFRFPTKPQDLVCALLEKYAYEHVDNFRNASVSFGLLTNPRMAKFVAIDPVKVKESTENYQAEFLKAVAFLSAKKLEGQLEGKEERSLDHAVKELQKLFDNAKQGNTLNL